MTPDDQARSRLSTAMNDRRVELRLKWNQVAQRAGISIAHLARIRGNEGPLTDLAKSSLETALEWPRGTIDQFLQSGEIKTPPAASPTSIQIPENASEAERTALQAIKDLLEAQSRELALLREEVQRLATKRDADNTNDERRNTA
ncbi:hypothetical protein [Microbispora sp. CA-102843]|uniref:hypothetical protein n=1 Tax=Microbispora sp. CA-102843 TaxID=3239952 RepID=UPI003D8ECA37